MATLPLDPPLDDLAAMVMTPPITVKTTRVTIACGRCRIRQSRVPDVIDLDLSCFKQCLNLEYLRRWWESSQLVGGHSQIGARCLLHLLVVYHEELLLDITGERRRATSGGLGGIFCFFIAMSLAISVPGFALMVLDTGFSIDSNAVMANHEKLSPKT